MTDRQDDAGLSVDILDVDRLRRWAEHIAEYGADLRQWSDPGFVSEWLRGFADRLETAVRDIGTLRALAGGPSPVPQEPERFAVLEARLSETLSILGADEHDLGPVLARDIMARLHAAESKSPGPSHAVRQLIEKWKSEATKCHEHDDRLYKIGEISRAAKMGARGDVFSACAGELEALCALPEQKNDEKNDTRVDKGIGSP